MSMRGGTSASSQIIWLENKVREQADEIERLREVVTLLIKYEEHDENIYEGAVMWDLLIEAAHAALKEK